MKYVNSATVQWPGLQSIYASKRLITFTYFNYDKDYDTGKNKKSTKLQEKTDFLLSL